jgi:uncharacterized OB-fold protein
MTDDNTRTMEATWHIEYEHAMGETAQQFFEWMRTDGELYGRHCPGCDRVLIPPRSFCDQCFTDTDEWMQVADRGEIHSVTVQHYSYEGLPDAPLAIVRVDLDGADTGLMHWADGDDIDLSDPDVPRNELAVGTRVRARWKPPEQRTGAITDIEYFEPV